MDSFMKRLEAVPADVSVALGVAGEGHELLALRRQEAVSRNEVVVPCDSVAVQVPEAPGGRVHVVLSRWSDLPGVLVSVSLEDGAQRPDWIRLDEVPGGAELTVKWTAAEEPRIYSFEWFEQVLPSGTRCGAFTLSRRVDMGAQ